MKDVGDCGYFLRNAACEVEYALRKLVNPNSSEKELISVIDEAMLYLQRARERVFVP